MIDYHLHSSYSIDSNSALIEFCDEAIKAGAIELGFSEHIDFDPTDPGYRFYNDLQYGQEMNILKSFYHPRLKLKKGVEVTYQPQFLDLIKKTLSLINVDFVIGSIHFVDDWNISSSDPEETGRFSSIDMKTAYEKFFVKLNELVQTGLFDIIGHFDIIARYGHKYYGDYNPEDFIGIIREILREIIKSGQILEINTSGLRNSPKHTYPHFRIVKEYAELGGNTVVFGSDAHSPDNLCFKFRRAEEMAKEAGIKYRGIFENRKIIERRSF
ncbi:MAG TPA: histidinol-phosphatase HisJ family protein [Firmicutes bacterium]|nr:histidinol-phosphatase HisJ family protein [Bacillota bacterium]